MPVEHHILPFPDSHRVPDWTDAIDRVVYAARLVHEQLSDCLAEAHLHEDPEDIARIAAAVKAIELDAAITLTAIVDREDRVRRKVGA